jgi:hypothetical protein
LEILHLGLIIGNPALEMLNYVLIIGNPALRVNYWKSCTKD